MPIKKSVIAAAGLGTRLLPITKELPKEMLPLFFEGKGGRKSLKPMLQAVFEQLYGAAFRQFCFIVGRGKRAIEDHFTPDKSFVEHLVALKKAELVEDLQRFYEKICNSNVVFVNQPEPKGFGDAVFEARAFTGSEPFLVHAGDDLIVSNNGQHILRLLEVFENCNAEVAFLAERVKDPSRYGVVEGVEVSETIYRVKRLAEKPKLPRTNLVAIAIYVFRPSIYGAIGRVKPDEFGEVQLTDAIQTLIDEERGVYALELKEGQRVDVGTPEKYWKALNATQTY